MKIGVFSLSSCSGCLVEFLNMEEKIIEIVSKCEITAMPIASSHIGDGPYDIVFIEGNPTTHHQVEELLSLRKKSRILVALGSCSALGGINAIIENKSFKEAMQRQYENKVPVIPVTPKPLDEYVEVDYKLYGCPFELSELLELFTCILNDKKYEDKMYDVCFECVLREVNCMLENGEPCMGPVTRGGCRARCPSNGALCTGCRGIYPFGNVQSHVNKLKSMGLSENEILLLYNKYGRRDIR